MTKLYVEQALSFGVDNYEGLWKIQYLHPLDANKKVQAWVPLNPDDESIGEVINNIAVAQPGVKLTEVMGWLHDRITRYPYYWPKEGTYVDKFGYDFEVVMGTDDATTSIDITQVAYEILMTELRVKPEQPENTQNVDIQFNKVAGGGVLIKLSVTLDRSQPVSELNLAPFTKYPMELMSLMYEEDIESFHPKKEILLPVEQQDNKKFEQTTQSIRFQFPVVTAKRFTIILRQQNPEKNTYTYNDEGLDKTQLWNQLSQREVEVTLDATDGLETVSATEVDKMTGWDIYLEQLKKYEKELLAWKKEFDLYKQKQSERERALHNRDVEDKRHASALSTYRAEFNAATAKYKTRVVNYSEQLKNYNTSYTKYQKDLLIYNKYLRDYGNWKSKWG